MRCIIERRRDVWEGFSLEYGLAVEGTSAQDVQRRIETMISSYLFDALMGEDREHAELLLSRRATIGVYFRYYLYKIGSDLRPSHGGPSDHKAFRAPLALEPRLCSP